MTAVVTIVDRVRTFTLKNKVTLAVSSVAEARLVPDELTEQRRNFYSSTVSKVRRA